MNARDAFFRRPFPSLALMVLLLSVSCAERFVIAGQIVVSNRCTNNTTDLPGNVRVAAELNFIDGSTPGGDRQIITLVPTAPDTVRGSYGLFLDTNVDPSHWTISVFAPVTAGELTPCQAVECVTGLCRDTAMHVRRIGLTGPVTVHDEQFVCQCI